MKKVVKLLVAGLALTASFAFMSFDVNAASTKVTADACKIRESASTSSGAICSVTQGQTLEVLGSTSSDDGYTWYQVKDGNNVGYIRADLVEAPDGAIESADSNDSADAATDATATGSTSSVTAAVVTADSVSVRSGASTSTSKVGTAKNGQEVSVLGESMDSDGYTWYQVSYIDGDKTVDGYIRSDFLQVTATAEPEMNVDEFVEEPVDEEYVPLVSQDYEVVYEANSEGVEEWFLYDHIQGTKQSINNIKAVMQQSMEYSETDNSQAGTLKIVIIIMAVVILVLIIGITVLLFKMRDSYDDYDSAEYDDEEYDEEEEEEEIEPVEEVEEEEEDEEDDDDYYKPKRVFGRGKKKESRRPSRRIDFDDDDDDDDDDDTYRKPTRRSRREEEVESKAWSTSGMLDIDDDMEFEFLDLDN